RDLQVRQDLRELVEQVALAAADIEHPHSTLDAVTIDQRLGQRPTAPVITIAAIAVAAFAVPIVTPPLPGDGGGFGLVMLDHALDVIALRGGMQGLNEVDFGHDRLPPRDITGWSRICSRAGCPRQPRCRLSR